MPFLDLWPCSTQAQSESKALVLSHMGWGCSCRGWAPSPGQLLCQHWERDTESEQIQGFKNSPSPQLLRLAAPTDQRQTQHPTLFLLCCWFTLALESCTFTWWCSPEPRWVEPGLLRGCLQPAVSSASSHRVCHLSLPPTPCLLQAPARVYRHWTEPKSPFLFFLFHSEMNSAAVSPKRTPPSI